MDALLQLIWALGMMAIAIAIAAWQRLGLAGSLALATGRTVLQLLVVGYVLAAVFALRNPWAVLGLLGVMLAIAAIVARNRISQKIPHLLPLVVSAIFIGSFVTLVYTVGLVIRPENWYEPRFLIPLAGITLGNSMNSAAIAGERLVSTLNASQLEIETHLSLGATPQQAVWRYRRDAIKAGMIAIVNSMMVVGLVTLPGVMVGQILGGAEPLQAAAYQILIMLMLAFTDLVTTSLITWVICQKFFNSAAQFITW
jgi:putative ABC transport system permease protein